MLFVISRTEKVYRGTSVRFCQMKFGEYCKDTFGKLRKVYEGCMSPRRIFERFKRFKNLCESFECAGQTERPLTSETEKNIELCVLLCIKTKKNH